jgi:hypothetical protein
MMVLFGVANVCGAHWYAHCLPAWSLLINAMISSN